MKFNENKKESGQAMVEYLVILIFVAAISVGLVKGLNTFLSASFGGLGRVLNDHLRTGVCHKDCLFNGYKNQ